MKLSPGIRISALSVLSTFLLVQLLPAQSATPTTLYPSYPSETPATFERPTDSFDYTRLEVMIPMRDAVKLHTIILIPKGAKGAPILLTRTPYSATKLTTHAESTHLGPILEGYDNATDVIIENGYIRVVQDIRGKYGSEGDYVMTRPLHGPLNPTPVDHATDTYDTIEWLTKHVENHNGKVGMWGISYPGFYTAIGMIDAHPALKAASPQAPVTETPVRAHQPPKNIKPAKAFNRQMTTEAIGNQQRLACLPRYDSSGAQTHAC